MGPYVTFSTPLELVCVEDDEQIESKFNELFLSTGNKTRQQLFDLFLVEVSLKATSAADNPACQRSHVFAVFHKHFAVNES